MIDNSNLKRARHIIKCAAGSPGITAPTGAGGDIHARYAAANGLIYKDGRFFSKDANGTETPVEVSMEELSAWSANNPEDGGGDGGDGGEVTTGENKKAKTLGMLNAGFDLGKAFLAGNKNVQNQSATTQTVNGFYRTASDTVSQFSPLAGTIMKGGSFASDALKAAGIKTDQVTKNDQWMDSDLFSWNIGLVNSLGAKKLHDFSVNEEMVAQVGGDYTGSVNYMRKQAELAGSKVGMFNNRGKMNEAIDEAADISQRMEGVAKRAKDVASMASVMGGTAADAYMTKISGGLNMKGAKLVKKGGVVEPKPFIPELIDVAPEPMEKIVPKSADGGSLFGQKINPSSGRIEDWSPELVDTWSPQLVDVESFKPGGKIEKQLDAPEVGESSQKNLIPEGALHKNKHHMENADGLTKKGIPVVTDDHQQQAEIECNEIIFNREVTKKLEELYREYYKEDTAQKRKDELAIEAGKLLTREIMLNTDDRTGLIDTLKSGGTLDMTKPDFKEWLASVPAKWISDNYDLEKAYEVLPFDVLERWRTEVLKDKQADDDSWHLPSVVELENGDYMFLKKGKTVKDNPELQGEFDFYTSDLDFNQKYKMKFNKEENRWYYVKRQK